MRVPASCEIPTKSTTRAAAKRTRRAKGAWTARWDIDSVRNTNTALPPPPEKRSKRSSGAPRNGKIRAPCMIRGARAAKRAPSWQDIRAVYPPTAICGAFRIHGAHILPKPARFGCMARRSCHEAPLFSSEAPFWIHGAQNLPRIAARERTAREYRHCQSDQERIRAQSCHRRTLGNAFRGHSAIVARPGTHQGIILPRSDAHAERPARP